MTPFALKEKDEGEWDVQKQRNLSFPPPWVHWEVDLLKMVPQLHQFNSLLSGPLFYKSYHVSQGWPDKPTLCQKTVYKFLLLRMNATLTLGQNHHLFRLPSPWREKLATVLILLWVPAMPWALGCLTDASSLPADRLRRQAESCSIQLAESNLPARMLSSYARGHGQSLSMWAGGKHSLEATVSG